MQKLSLNAGFVSRDRYRNLTARLRIPTAGQIKRLRWQDLRTLVVASAVGLAFDEEMWNMVHDIVSIAPVCSLRFPSSLSFDMFPRTAEVWPIRAISIEKSEGDWDSADGVARLLACSKSLEHLYVSYGSVFCSLSDYFEACLTDVVCRSRLRLLCLENIELDGNQEHVPNIATHLPRLHTFTISFSKVSGASASNAIARTLSALFKPSEPATSLRTFVISVDRPFHSLFTTDPVQGSFERFLDQHMFPALQNFTFNCLKRLEHFPVETQRTCIENGGPTMPKRQVDEDYRMNLEKLLSGAPAGLRLSFGYIKGSVGLVESFAGSSGQEVEARYW